MGEDIQSYQIKRAKRGALRATNCRPGNTIDLFDGVAIVEHCLDCIKRTESANPISDKIRPIFGRHDSLAQPLIEKTKYEAGDFRERPLGTDYLDEMQIARRIEKVDTEKVFTEIFGTSFRQEMNRDTARIRGDYRTRATMLFYAFVKGAFDVEIFDDCFNYQIAVFEFCKVVIEIAN